MNWRPVLLKEDHFKELKKYYFEHRVELVEMDIHSLNEFVSELSMIGFKRFVQMEEAEG